MDLQLSQALKQKLSAQQIQTMQLLSLPYPLLIEKIKQEVEENPALAAQENPLPPTTSQVESNNKNDDENTAFWDQEAYYDGQYNHEENRYIDKKDPYQELLEQLHFELFDEKEKEFATFLIGNLDENGYLAEPWEEILSHLEIYQNFKISSEKALSVVEKLQNLEPKGLGAKNLQDCLLIQLKYKKKDLVQEKLIQILENDFELLRAQKIKLLQEKHQITPDFWAKIMELLGQLHPKPLHLLEGFVKEAEKIIPDFVVEIDEKDQILWRFHQPFGIQIGLDPHFEKLKTSKIEAKEFIQQKLQSGKNFLQALQLRKKLLRSGFLFLLQHQKTFFLTGDPQNLRPLILKEMAEVLGVDISTISRLVKDKYVATPFGIFPLKKLFLEGLSTEKGEISILQIKEKIKEFLINGKYSDQKIADLLQKEGIQIARRTVNKYRKEIENE